MLTDKGNAPSSIDYESIVLLLHQSVIIERTQNRTVITELKVRHSTIELCAQDHNGQGENRTRTYRVTVGHNAILLPNPLSCQVSNLALRIQSPSCYQIHYRTLYAPRKNRTSDYRLTAGRNTTLRSELIAIQFCLILVTRSRSWQPQSNMRAITSAIYSTWGTCVTRRWSRVRAHVLTKNEK